MQLNDILEENSIKAMSDKTKIPEENLEYLIESDFDALTKVRTLGFISILEREYKADLSAVREQALEYYGQGAQKHLFPMGKPVVNEHKSKSNGLFIFVFILLGFSTWYFLTQFDKKHLNTLIPFMDEQTIEGFIGSDEEENVENIAADLTIDSVTVALPKAGQVSTNDAPLETQGNSAKDVANEEESVTDDNAR
ncbi:MAG: hypothetical protein U9O64_10080 [Campylobacterota bacterium]|nr:hypothetical protein [Campylobacterota bacterium]